MFAQQYIRYWRILFVLVVYSLILGGSFWTAYLLRFDFAIPPEEFTVFSTTLFVVVPFQLIVLLLIGHCAGLLSYFSLPDVRRLFYGLGSTLCLLLVGWACDSIHRLPPRSVLLGNFVFAFGGLCGVRLCLRVARERYFTSHGKPQIETRRVGIIGAGDVGAALARDLISKRGLGMQPVAFFDDNQSKWHSHIHNIPVLGASELLTNGNGSVQLDEVVIAMPSAPAKRIKEIVKLLQEANLKFTTVPSLSQLASGKVSVSHLRPVEIGDLLGREPITLEDQNVRQYLAGRIVMVTGAGGSIGSELCRQIARFKPQRLLLVDQSEVQLFQIEQELIETGHREFIVPFVGDVVDESRMRQIFRQAPPQVIFHAAAHKHVPMMESQPSEAVKNNAFGTAKLSQLALEFGAERFVMISTDKAINPTSVMGVTKRLAELYVQALSTCATDGTKFMAVRFGNVLGSSGSVVPTFKRQIAAGGPVKVTHPEVERYFMTIPEAVSLVLQSGALGSGGEIFVLDMGKPVRIADLARQLIELSGLKPGDDIEIEYVGLRPGEKLFEELQHKAENLLPTQHAKILRFISQPLPLEKIKDCFNDLRNCLYNVDPIQLKLLIKQIVPEYTPYFEDGGKRDQFPLNRLTGWKTFPSENILPRMGARVLQSSA